MKNFVARATKTMHHVFMIQNKTSQTANQAQPENRAISGEVRIEKGYFRGQKRFGRTTRLVVDGVAVLEVLGVVGKRDLVKQYERGASVENPEAIRVSIEQSQAIELHTKLDSVKIDEVPTMAVERNISRKDQARLARELLRKLDIKNVSITSPSYSMAQAVHVRLPKRSDYKMNRFDMVDDYATDPAAIANRRAENKLEMILLAAFPNSGNRSDTQTDHFDYKWSIN